MKIVDIIKESPGIRFLDYSVEENLPTQNISRQYRGLVMDPDKLVKVFGKPQIFTERTDDLDYLWEIVLTFKDPSVHNMHDEDDFGQAIFHIYTVKYDPEDIPPLSQQTKWNIGMQNDIVQKHAVMEFLQEKGLL